MFEQSMVTAGPASRWPMISSIALQMAGVGGLLLVPLIWWEQLGPIQLPPPGLFLPRPPAMKVFTEGFVKQSMTAPALTTPRRFEAPRHIPERAATIRDKSFGDPVAIDGVGKPGALDSIVGAFDTSPLAQNVAPPPPPQPKPVEAKPAPKSVTVSSTLQASKLIHQVKPAYPELAKRAGIQGVVRLHAVIAQDGSVQKLQVTSGHPLLVLAAVEAVKQWRYSPTLLGGNPVEVVTQVDVNFVLSR